LAWIEVDLNRLAVVSKIMVGRILLCAPGISDPGSNHTFDGPKLGIGPPESPQGKSGGFDPAWRRGVDGGD